MTVVAESEAPPAGVTEVHVEDIALAARDGHVLAGRLWSSKCASRPALVALINAGAGIRQGYYAGFAEFLAAAGIPTLTYDYRGIGGSRPASLTRFAASVEQWGSLDCTAAIELVATRFPKASRLVIGHSVGGFVTGFALNGSSIDRMLLISGHTGYWGDYAPAARPWMFALWHVFMPAVTSIVGYFPGRAFRLGDDLPAGVAKEWANRRRGDFWWNLRTQSGAPDTARRDALLSRFRSVRATTLAVRFADDPFATERATRRLLSLYENATAASIEVDATRIGCPRIGHFGFFRRQMRRALWPRVLGWLGGAPPDPYTGNVGATN